MQAHYEEIRSAGGEVLVVSFSAQSKLRPFLERQPLPMPVVFDSERAAYRAFGLGRTSWLRILAPDVLGRSLRKMLRGWLPRRPVEGEDILQLGGDFVLDRRRRLVYAYRSSEPTDRPPAGQLVEAVRAAAREESRASGKA